MRLALTLAPDRAWPHARHAGSAASMALLLAGCPGGSDEDGSTSLPVATTTATGTTTATQGPDSEDATASTLDPETTGCTPGLPGCTCLPDDTCMGDLECEGGTCREPSGSTTEDDATTGAPGVCGNGMAEAGELCLGSATPFTMGTGAIAIAVANFDADPALDLVTANRDVDTVSIRLGSGAGDFGTQSQFPSGAGPIGIGAGDFNGDGNLDVVTANVTSIDVTMLPGTGTGDFGAAMSVPLSVMLVPTDLAVVDLEGDGDPDVLVTESTLGVVHVLRTEAGAFLPAATYAVGAGSSGVHTADFSGDDVPDAVTSDATAGTVSLLLGNGFGQLGGASSSSVGVAPSDVSSGDFNGDGLTDAIVSNPGGDVTIRLGNGLGGFGGQLLFPVPGGPVALVAADLDLDGDTDVAVVGGDSMIHVLLGNGSGSLAAVVDIPVGSLPDDIVAIDLNDDGLLDLVTANTGAGGVSVVLTNA